MIKYIRYKQEGGVDIYDGEFQVKPFTIENIIDAINHRLKNIPIQTVTSVYHQYSEETCFLVRLAYHFDKLVQYVEKPNIDKLDNTLILNFCNSEFVSIYSICFNDKRDFFRKGILIPSWSIKFSYDIKAPLLTLEEVRANKFEIYFFHLLLGRPIYRDKLYYRSNEKGFCLPILALIEEMVKNNQIENYIKKIEIKLNDDIQRVYLHVITSRQKYGTKHLENNYYEYLELNGFNFIIEKHEQEHLSS